MANITLSMHDILVQHFGTSVTVPATIDIDQLLDFACDDDEHEIDVDDYLAKQQQIAIIWGIDDVKSVRPDLSDEQAWEALKFAHRGHDASFGLNWECLESAAEALYGLADESTASNGGDHE